MAYDEAVSVDSVMHFTGVDIWRLGADESLAGRGHAIDAVIKDQQVPSAILIDLILRPHYPRMS